jgi:electron transport complex protein RnfC
MTRFKTLPRGGVRPPEGGQITLSLAIENAPVPPLALIPMLQHKGSPAECVVRPGDRVREGMLIGRESGDVSANVHSSIPGVVVDILEVDTPALGRSRAIAIELGGEFGRSGKPRREGEWESLSGEELFGRIRSAGVVGMGGGLVPTHVKLANVPGRPVGLLVGNGVGTEPPLSADHALMREKPREIAEGLRVCRRILGAPRVVLALGEDDEELVPSFERIFAEKADGIEVAVLSSMYPQGHEALVIAAVAGGSLPTPPPRGDSVVFNVATLVAVYESVALDKPHIERVVTVTGPSIQTPRNLKVRIGTPIGELFAECGGLSSEPGKVVLGGAMRGTSIDSLAVPVTKGVGGVQVFARGEAARRREWPCIRCGACIEACPWALAPVRLYKLIDSGETRSALEEGLRECTECGCCAYVCPSRIPLVEGFHRGRVAAARGRDV